MINLNPYSDSNLYQPSITVSILIGFSILQCRSPTFFNSKKQLFTRSHSIPFCLDHFQVLWIISGVWLPQWPHLYRWHLNLTQCIFFFFLGMIEYIDDSISASTHIWTNTQDEREVRLHKLQTQRVIGCRSSFWGLESWYIILRRIIELDTEMWSESYNPYPYRMEMDREIKNVAFALQSTQKLTSV